MYVTNIINIHVNNINVLVIFKVLIPVWFTHDVVLVSSNIVIQQFHTSPSAHHDKRTPSDKAFNGKAAQ